MKTALVFACDDNFIAYPSVVARRVSWLSSDKFPIVIISDGVSDENKRLARKFCPRISFIEAGNLFGERRFHTTTSYARATYLRLYLDEILADFDRVVYMDGDMTPLVDLSPLLHMVPKAAPVMATYSFGYLTAYIYKRLPLSPDAGYLQGGLQIFDLKAVREERIFKDAIQFALDHPEKCELVDQDALNVALQGRWQVMDWRWNVMSFEAKHAPSPVYIRHHGGGDKPWTVDKTGTEQHIIEQWQHDLAESPWPNKFLPEQKKEVPFSRKYVRPLTRAIEVPLKALFRGDFETLLHGEQIQRDAKRYLERLPSLFKKVEEAAREGRLATAL
jgi:lipopolysaccharide biosynthesis glycosyltransferase